VAFEIGFTLCFCWLHVNPHVARASGVSADSDDRLWSAFPHTPRQLFFLAMMNDPCLYSFGSDNVDSLKYHICIYIQ
jgi:hypothetical protein